jgi:hypothetical protein
MKRHSVLLTFILVTTSAAAQQPITIEGTVVSLTAEQGTEAMASLVVRVGHRDVTLRLAPMRFLEENGFAASPGDFVEVSVLRTKRVVSSVRNATTGVIINLRDSSGNPLWDDEVRSRGASEPRRYSG